MTKAPYVTVSEAAELMGMTPDGVRKCIRSGRLVAVKRSERKTLVSRLSIQSYQDRLNGKSPALPASAPPVEPAARIESFRQRHGVEPDVWLGAWRKQAYEDTAAVMQTAIEALSLELERAGEKTAKATVVARAS